MTYILASSDTEAGTTIAYLEKLNKDFSLSLILLLMTACKLNFENTAIFVLSS